jgi:hypothetical protein
VTVLTRPAASGVSARWAAIKAALARAIERGMEARMIQIRREIDLYRLHRTPPRRVRTSR